MHQIVLYYVKRIRIERDQLFIQLHDVALINSVEQQLYLLPKLMREIDSIEIKLNLS
jgi:hypothetical protein